MAKVAVASTDGININEHFGRSREFLIYEVNETGTFQFLETRQIPPATDSEHMHAASRAVELLGDVEAVLVAQIGPRAESELLGKGIYALPVTGPIDRALPTYGRRGKLLQRIKASRPAAGCPGTSGAGGCGGACRCE
jgi:nitrogen fixation protein NifX